MMIMSDLKYALRLLAKKPGFTLLTTLVMATGIGLSIYLFSFFNTMVFKDMPFQDGGSLVQISTSRNGLKNAGMLNYQDYQEVRSNLQGLTEFTAYRATNFNVTGRDGARRYSAAEVEPGVFQVTRTQPSLGRVFTDLENQPGSEAVVLIGYEMWQNQFGGTSQIIDQIVRINGVSHRVIGVMPQGYVFPNNTEIWRPMKENLGGLRDQAGSVYGLAHVQDGASLQEINGQLGVIMQRLQERYPETNNGISAYVTSIPLATAADGLPVIYSIQIIAILVLILASINVGNLLLSRAIERSKETAIRVALGAPRSRLIGQMMWESIIICSVGGFIGLLVLAWGLDVTQRITSTFNIDLPPFWWKFGIDAYTIKLFVCFVVGTILVTGLLPAWKNSGSDFNAVLRDGTRGALGKKTGRMNRFLIICEIFVSMTVLIAAGALLMGNYKATRADYGADPTDILTAEIMLTENVYDSPEKQIQFIKSLQSNLENTTGIGEVMISTALPGAIAPTPAIAVDGKEYNEKNGYPRSNYIVVTPGSLEKLGVELKAGRFFDSSDEGLDKRSIIVTESFVEKNMPGESPIGKRIRNVEADGSDPQWLTIVGVVEHTIQGPSYQEAGKTASVFRPYSQAPKSSVTIAMKIKSGQADAERALRSTLSSMDSNLPAFRIEPYTAVMERHTKPMLFITSIFLMFGIAAVVLASSGIYGVMSNTINQRTQEIGVKRALGAQDERITKEFLKAGIKQFFWGGIPGLLIGGAMGFAMSAMLGTGTGDLVIVVVLLVSAIGGTVLMATYLPTQRALKMEPSQALRYE